MIDFDTQIKIQAFLDGELGEADTLDIAALIAADREAAALHKELKQTRQALLVGGEGVSVPETRDFYWSKIRREIEELEPARPVQADVSLWHQVARWLKPFGAVAAAAIVGILAWQQMGEGNAGGAIVTAQIDPDAGAITFRDSSTGTTFVWFNYPAENDVAN